jgi:protein required for attachment to host cells
MKKTWVVVADSARARIFCAENTVGGLIELETLAHPQGRLHEQDMTSDLPGSTFDRAGPGRHDMEPHTNPKDHEMQDFARRIVAHLEQGRSKQAFSQLILIAAPSFLGALRGNIKNGLAKTLVHQEAKNLTQCEGEEIRRHLPDLLPSMAV